MKKNILYLIPQREIQVLQQIMKYLTKNKHSKCGRKWFIWFMILYNVYFFPHDLDCALIYMVHSLPYHTGTVMGFG